METDITNFLIKYPNIEPFGNDILNPYDSFYDSIYNKKEFYDVRLQSTEEIPTEPGILMKNQQLISRFFSSNTLYDELLLLHEMGTGKTCTAIGAIEQIRKEGMFKGVLYLGKGQSLIDNFINELVFKCTDGRYIPTDYNSLTELEKVHRIRKGIKDYYHMNTFETFADVIRTYKTRDVLSKWDNHIIVIDEVHNVRSKDSTHDTKHLNIYKEFWYFLHTIKDCKILLMSGTPMKDSVEEIASVMNLILPETKQIQYTGQDFIDYFFDMNSEDIYTIKLDKITELKDIFKGRVSYLKSMQSDVKKVFQGNKLGELKHLIVSSDIMSNFQSESYKKAYDEDIGSDHKGVYSNSRQASLFVFPDGTWGLKGFEKFIAKEKISSFRLEEHKSKKSKYRYSFDSKHNLASFIKADTHKEMLTKLSIYSSKYAESIRCILQAREENKCVFVYNEFVTGSGIILFCLILELFGFRKATGKEPNQSENPRYVSLTSETTTAPQIKNLIARFNEKDNIHGKIINIIIGSRKIAEGFTFKNIQVVDIHTPWFNYSETSQAIARGYRAGSHRDLPRIPFPQVSIYQRVSIPSDRIESSSIDLIMYTISENKDISIKSVERIMKESAWDCALTYNRNHITGYDNQRECDYDSCDYTCDEVIRSDRKEELDLSSFYYYYNTSHIESIKNQIIHLFRTYFRMNLDDIKDKLKEFSMFEIISALRELINDNKKIINKYGLPSYLKEDNNIFFLVNSLSEVHSESSNIYVKYPNIQVSTDFNHVIEPLYNESIYKIIEMISNVTSIKELRKLIIRVPITIREYFLESSIQNILTKETKGQSYLLSTLILEYFKYSYFNFDGIWVSWLLDETQENINLRFFDQNKENAEWNDCDEEYTKKIEEHKRYIQEQLDKNPYRCYGIYNPDNKEFCIRFINEEEKGNKKTSGVRCSSINLPKLFSLIFDTLQLPFPSEIDIEQKNKILEDNDKPLIEQMRNIIIDIKRKNKKELIDDILKNKNTKKVPQYTTDTESFKNKTISEEDLRRILFWLSVTNKDICTYLHTWFEEKKYYIIDNSCGLSSKLKPK
jgi:hypothetical protein